MASRQQQQAPRHQAPRQQAARRRAPARVEVRRLGDADAPAAARLLTDAFLDDPLWRAVGPSRAWRRRAVITRAQRGSVAKARHWGGPHFVAVRERVPVGVAITFASEEWPPRRLRALLYDTPALLIAGPAATVRGLRVGLAIERARPPEPHVYLWLLGVAPHTQRTGVGSALLEAVAADAADRSRPVYLETFRSENAAYYRARGFELLGEQPLGRGAHAWFLLRRPRQR